MEKVKKGVFWTVIASESIHVFCCVLPTVFSVISLLAGFGIVATMPGFIEQAHDVIHAYEVPMIIASGIILLFGWVVYIYSRSVDCSDNGQGCCHEPCVAKKDRTRIFMMIATILFIVNVSLYLTIHVPMDHSMHHDNIESEHTL